MKNLDCEERKNYRVCAPVDLAAIRQNVSLLRAHLPAGVKFCAVVKADGYGHGALPVAQTVEDEVDLFAVATAEEAFALKEAGIKKPILVLGYVHPSYFSDFIRQEIRPTIFDTGDAEAFSQAAVREEKTGFCHIAVDTGMNRIGFIPDGNSREEILKIAKMPALQVEGIFTHFACSDEKDRTVTELQYRKFTSFLKELQDAGLVIPICHCSNSGAILDYAEYGMNMVRAGIVIYGLYPSEEVSHREVVLTPAMQLKSHVILVKQIGAGERVSYGGTYVAENTRTVATVPVGYGDGYPRLLSNKGAVLIKGRRAPILGRVCMDQMMVDVTDIEDVRAGDVVTLLGRDGDEEIPAEELAALSETISYEIVCGFSARVPRIYKTCDR